MRRAVKPMTDCKSKNWKLSGSVAGAHKSIQILEQGREHSNLTLGRVWNLSSHCSHMGVWPWPNVWLVALPRPLLLAAVLEMVFARGCLWSQLLPRTALSSSTLKDMPSLTQCFTGGLPCAAQ